MPEVVKERSIFTTPLMSAEDAPELRIKATPIRVSGFVALFIGLGSFVAVLGEPLIVVPVAAIGFALLAIRPYDTERPVGIVAAYIGMFCAVLFGIWGISERHFKTKQMSLQAERYALNWLDLVKQGDLELAIELQVAPSRRQPDSMPLADYYERSETAVTMMKQFKEQDTIPSLIELGTKPNWQLAQPSEVYVQFGRELTQTVWKDTTGHYKQSVKIVMEYLPGTGTEKAQWKIELVSNFFEDNERV